MEAFNSETQYGLFNVPAEHVAEHAADSFLSGLSRAFTLNSTTHTVARQRDNERHSATAVFHGNVRSFRVTVEELEPEARQPMSNDDIIEAVQTYCADLHAAHEASGGLDRADGSFAWTPENAAHVAALLNQASGEFDPIGLFRFMDEQTGSWRVGYRTRDGREWFHVLRQMRNAREGGLFETLGK